MEALTANLTPDEVVERGKAIYEQDIRAQVEADNIGKLLMIDVLTGHWVMGDDRIEMARRLRDQNPVAQNYALRIGYPATLGIGATVRPFSEKSEVKAMPSHHTQLTFDEIADRGQAIYEERLRPQVREGNFGKYLVIDVISGEYEIGADHLATAQRARAKHPNAPLFGMRIGYPAVAAIGATLRPLPGEENA